MMKLMRKAFYGTLLFIILIITTVSFFVSTTPGLYAVIKISNLFFPGTLKVHQLTGRLLDNFSIGALNYQHKDVNITINKATIRWNFKDLFHHQVLIERLNADSIELKQNNSIHILKNIIFSGLLNQQIGGINTAQFNFLDQQITTQLQIDAQLPYNLSGKIKFNSNVIPVCNGSEPRPLGSGNCSRALFPLPNGHGSDQQTNNNKITGTIDIGGNLNQMQWTGDLHGPLELSINGTLKQLSELTQVIKWRELNWKIDKNRTLSSPQGRVNISGAFPVLKMELSSKFNTVPEDYWQMKAIINGTFPWQWNLDANLSHPNSLSSKSEGLSINLSAKGMIKDKNHGNLSLTLNPGHYQMPDDTILPTLQFIGGTVQVTLSPQSLSGKGVLAIDQNKQLNLKFILPQFNLIKGLSSNQPLSGELSLVLSSLDFLQNITPELNNPKGQLTASLKATGTLGKALIESKFNLSKTSVALPTLGLVLDAIDLAVVSKKNHWEATGSISSASKKLLIKGNGPLNSKMVAELSVQGSDFPIVKTQEYQISISPQLKLNITPTSINISGSILVPNAQIKPQTFTNSLTLSDDVVYKTKEEIQPSPFNTSMDVKVEMGNQVELTFKGLHATLNGSANVTQRPHGPINANGELSVKEGEYKAYGQDLDIEQGQLMFTGGRVDNPGINLRASKIINNSASSSSASNQLFDFNTNNIQSVNLGSTIKVGVEVTGRLTAPKILLFSNPSILSQADILSMLILGRPASQANKAGGQLLLAAISSMNLGTGTNGAQLLEQLKQNLGFDINVQTNTNYNQQTNRVTGSTSFVVGKSLSKRLYLSYNVGLSQTDPNVLTLKYLLNKFLSIQVSGSKSGNGIDLLYSRSKRKINE